MKKLINAFEMLQLVICGLSILSLLFLDYRKWEVGVLILAPIAIVNIIEFFKGEEDDDIDTVDEK
jgi:hypothetical protein